MWEEGGEAGGQAGILGGWADGQTAEDGSRTCLAEALGLLQTPFGEKIASHPSSVHNSIGKMGRMHQCLPD